MDYLALVNQGMLLSRVGEARLSEPLTTFAGATGPVYEMIQWIAQADLDLQLARNGWLFMRDSADLLLPEGQSELVPAASLSTIRSIIPAEDDGGRRSIGCYKDSLSDESRITLIDYEAWYGNALGGVAASRQGRPSRFTERSGKLYFDATADANYKITFDFLRKPTRMTVTTSESVIPVEHRMAIVWWALTRYYCTTRDKAGDFRGRCGVELDREMHRLYGSQLFAMVAM